MTTDERDTPEAARARQPRLLSWRLGAVALAAVLALGAALWLSGLLSGPGGPRAMPPAPVKVVAVGFHEFVDRLEAIGTARSNESVQITAKVTETVRTLSFEDGASVEAGQILAELIDAEQSADLAEARAALIETQKQYDRIADLVAKGSAARSRLDTQRAARDAAQARVEALEARLEDRIIRAPFAGVLGLRAVSPGTLVKPGDRIVTLDDIGLIKVDFSVPESFLSALRPGLEIKALTAAYPEHGFVGVVRTIDTRVDPVTRAIIVRAEIPNPEGLLRPGMLVTVDLIKNRQRSLMVPEEALIPLEQKQFVMVVRDGKAERREVAIGRREPGAVEVLAGLSEGDVVVVEGTHRAVPGGPVQVVGEEAAVAGTPSGEPGRAQP